MPAWWGRRRHKNNKPDDHADSPTSNKSPSFPTTPSSVKSHSSDVNARSFDDPVAGLGAPVSAFLRSPGLAHRTSSGFSGFDSDGCGGAGSGSGGGRECHPLPRPSVSSNLVYAPDHNGGVGLGNGGSASVSSVSSSGSSDDAIGIAISIGVSFAFSPFCFLANSSRAPLASAGPTTRSANNLPSSAT